MQRSGSLLVHYNGNLKRALFSLFPDIGLVKSKFDILPCMILFFYSLLSLLLHTI